MKKMLIMLIATTVVAVGAISVLADNKGPEQITLDASMGAVNFNHAEHQNRTDCTTCHHQGEFTSCHSCHDGKVAPKAKKVLHDTCKGCHQEMQSGPTKCKECHIK
ncbi:MAG: hypothetical protein C0619_03565 [Desulfuromonas sp.]|mgnify:CR=1 FL=1|nr:MAG: hypothetical protein C0619_03565 [Desulfuromonas sp.]